MACEAVHYSSRYFLSRHLSYRFRWVVCQLEVLRRCLASNLRRQINELPQSLDETYERVLKEIHSANQDDARRLLHCLTVAQRPLRVEELAEILAYDLDAVDGAADGEIATYHAEWRWEDQEQAVLLACSSLISIIDDQGSRVVQFSHFSVKEFLTSKRLAEAAGEVSQYHILLEPAHNILAQACLGVLLRLDDRVDEKSAKEIPLAEYAAEHWASHAQLENVTTHLRHAMETLFDSEKPHFLAWLRVYGVNQDRLFRSMTGRRRIKVFATPLYYSSLYGFYDLVEQLVMKDPQHVNAIGGDHGFPLVAALRGKHVRVAEFLLEHGAKINFQGPTPLHEVIGWSDDASLDAMQFLLKHGADVNAREDDLSTPLHLAVSEGGFKAAQLLLENKANSDSRNWAGKTPLHLVSSFNYRPDSGPRLAQLLLEYDADVNAEDEEYTTPLHFASGHHRLDIAQILLDHGAKADAKNKKLVTPLHLSLDTGDELSFHRRNGDVQPDLIGLVQLLLENGAEVDSHDENYRTALYMVFYLHLGRRDIAEMLLDWGAKVDATDKWGRTMLHQMSQYKDRVSSVQLLLELGADVNAQDNDHITPLHLASAGGKLEIARVLLDHGAKVNAESNRGETPLHRLSGDVWSKDSEHPRIARLLLERGADVNAREKGHATPLHLASEEGSFDVAQILLACGADVNAKNDRDQTPLFLLLQHGHIFLDLVRLLVEYGADANTRNYENTTALHDACYHEGVEVVRVLLNHGANVEAKDCQGQSPFHRLVRANRWTASNGLAVQVAHLLLNNNADVNAEDEDHVTLLHLACTYKKLDLALVLMDHGAIVDVQNKQGRTPLHVLVRDSYVATNFKNIEDIARLLLERGANANARDKDNATPLHLTSAGFALPLAPVLLDCGANASAKDNLGRAPLHRLLTNSYFDSEEDCLGSVHLLLRDGIDVNAETEGGATALHLAFDHHKLKIAKVLFDNGANPDVKDNLGETPLNRLLKNTNFNEDPHLDAVQLLLEHGANPNVQDNDGVTLLQLASRKGMPEVTRLLLEYGAKDATENDQTPPHTAQVSS
jgi:ankyrin repeat protein